MTRLEAYAVTGGYYVYGTYPEIDGLFSEQINEPAFLNGVGPGVEVRGLNAITSHASSAPYETLKLKKK